MRSMALQDVRVLVLAADDAKGGKGALFELFVAKILAEQFGFSEPTRSNVNVTSNGIELDIVSRHRLFDSSAIAECKAYSGNVAANELTNFYGKLTVERFVDADAYGLFCALPRLTPQGEEKAKVIEAQDRKFKYLSSQDIAEALLRGGLVADMPQQIQDASDEAIVITDLGIFSACIVLDAEQRTAQYVAVWGAGGVPTPEQIRELLATSDYAEGLPVRDVGSASSGGGAPTSQREVARVVVAEVAGSKSDFEYQLPASPKYFVGRAKVLKSFEELLVGDNGKVVVLNAQSGWGKSSLALKMGDLATKANGVAIVLDTRTANQPRYVVEVLRRLGAAGESRGVLTLPKDASWASLESALATFAASVWREPKRPLVAFFDQFENVFRDIDLTRAFRDLALGVRGIDGNIVLGFAWKTDLVGWTEGHPYQMRDDIRGSGFKVLVEPFGSREVDVILQRLAKQASVRLLPDLRSRLRAYSQGLPWLLKKLADHVLRELERGETQEGLLAESLNIVSLFEADLSELSPPEQTVLRHVARFAPIAASEVTERFAPDAVQSLVDRRLIVQVGDQLDTYWDTFRDFLNTGTVPVQESWILRQTPSSVSRLLPLVVEAGGDISVKDLERQLATSVNAIFNLSRELRLLGVTVHEPNRVRLADEVLNASDREQEMRRRVGSALRKHKAFTTLRRLAERSGGQVTLDSYTRELPNAFPAVDVATASWQSYARAFLFWMEYAGMVQVRGADYTLAPEGVALPITTRLLGIRSPLKFRSSVPNVSPGRAMAILQRLGKEGEIDLPTYAKDREAVGNLFAIGAVTVTPSRKVRLVNPELVSGGVVQTNALRELLATVPGGYEGLAVLDENPAARPEVVGLAISRASHAKGGDGYARNIGGIFRSWAKAAGVKTEFPKRRALGDRTDGS